jgi:hypothetical protein
MAKTFSDSEVQTARRALLLAFDTFGKRNTFAAKQFVRWKEGMKNRKRPAYGEPAIVVQVLEESVRDMQGETEAGSPYFREPLDLVIGLLGEEDNEFLLFHVDSRRFEAFPST